jgi:hypothetical protein
MSLKFNIRNNNKMSSNSNQNISQTDSKNCSTTLSIDFNRKIIQLIFEKKQQVNYFWTSASKFYNYFNDDPLVDWFNLYGLKKGYKKDDTLKYEEYISSLNVDNSDKMSFEEFNKKYLQYNFFQFILKQGIEFENYVVNKLREKFGDKIVNANEIEVCDIYDYSKKLKITSELINQTTPIIYQGFVCDPDTKTFGYPDLIVREDYLPGIFGKDIVPIVKDTYLYYIVDIKYHSLNYKKDCGTNGIVKILSNKSQQHYVYQTYIYTKGLRHLLNYDILPKELQNSYIIGRNWNLTNSNNSVGEIVFQDFPNILSKLEKGIIWFKDLKSYGNTWDPENPNRLELFPNMKNDRDTNWDKTKMKLAHKNKELTLLWNCGPSMRNKIVKNGIYSWDNPTLDTNDYFGENVSPILKSMIKVNKEKIDVSFNKDATFEKYWKSNKAFDILTEHCQLKETSISNTIVIDGFIDIENTIDVKSIDTLKEDSITYMIGLYYNYHPVTNRTKTYKTQMCQKTFCAEKLNTDSERMIIRDFLLFLKNYTCEKHIIWRLYHYSGFEDTTLCKLMKKYSLEPLEYGITIEWIDMHDIIKTHEFVFNGCFDYSLKSINKILHKRKYIPDDCIYENSVIKNGMDSVIATYKCNEISINDDVPLNKIFIMKDIEYYNMIDCVSLFYIRNFLETKLGN